MKRTGLILAAGRGTRAGGGLPKQYRMLAGEPILRHSIRAILASTRIDTVRVVIHPDDIDHYNQCISGITDTRLQPPVYGADTRSASALNGLRACTGDLVFIHDGARPLLPLNALERVIDALETNRAAFLALPVTDALWQVDGKNATTAQPRDTLWRGQTPQAFHLNDILAAHVAADHAADDDVALARLTGLDVVAVLGSELNMKVTQPEDFALAERLLGSTMDIRVGNGFDVHKLGAGDHVVLCGIKIPFDRGLIGHSDADVGMHAITDAIFGAISAGDIGQWFPPSDIQWKGAASDIFLKKAVEVAVSKGFNISNIDCTLICEQPKIGPHALAMRQALAAITGVALDRISVKATTSEKLGFTGRGEGIAAQATATLVKT
ncbi:MAG: bifunctional 2-C-methyl-D-erythritol 4-phosphate cytidylyltransferase/2-C-methyl-D-erythritol 2,4-cyclodiphosphate synthase [Amylibacter sp.]|nr:bifunctional 2-C-methyl-D-erythritol 4-phosphate cytidylyltransferase/2-C-methyl-D-erythritol 2,4-cyclodiphosphate synthase [Amylibacter sp.]